MNVFHVQVAVPQVQSECVCGKTADIHAAEIAADLNVGAVGAFREIQADYGVRKGGQGSDIEEDPAGQDPFLGNGKGIAGNAPQRFCAGSVQSVFQVGGSILRRQEFDVSLRSDVDLYAGKVIQLCLFQDVRPGFGGGGADAVPGDLDAEPAAGSDPCRCGEAGYS